MPPGDYLLLRLFALFLLRCLFHAAATPIRLILVCRYIRQAMFRVSFAVDMSIFAIHDMLLPPAVAADAAEA